MGLIGQALTELVAVKKFLFVIVASIVISASVGQANARPTLDLSTSLVAYWHFDEESGTRLDEVGSSDLVIGGGTPGFDLGRSSNAVEFTDDGDWLYADDNLNIGMDDAQSFTIAGWYRIEDKDNAYIFVSKGASNEYEVYYSKIADRFRFYTAAGAVYADSFGDPSPDDWVFIVAWYDATADTVNIQVNGGTVNTADAPGTIPDTTGPLYVGKNDFDNGMHGLVDEVGIWRRTLTSTERQQIFTCFYPFASCGDGQPWSSGITPSGSLGNSLAGYWPLDELAGFRYDYFGSNHTNRQGPNEWLDTLINGEAEQEDDRVTVGKLGNAAQFNDNSFPNDDRWWLNAQDTTSLSISNTAFSIAFWAKLDSRDYLTVFVAKSNVEVLEFEYEVYYSDTDDRIKFYTPAADEPLLAESFGPPPLDDWFYVVAWFDGDNMYLQINNGDIDQQDATGVITDTVQPFYIGRSYIPPGGFFAVDEVGFWRRTLTDSERSYLYNSGDGCVYPFATCDPTSGAVNLLDDGNFNDPLTTSEWDYNGGADRINMNVPGVLENIGPAWCYPYYADVSPDGAALTAAIIQRFYWPGGGDAYFQARIRSTYVGGTFPHVYFQALSGGDPLEIGMPPSGEPYLPYTGATWQTIRVIIDEGDFPAGWYDLVFEEESDDGGFQVDDVTLAYGEWYTHCGEQPGTPSPTPNGTATATPTGNTPTATGPTPTPTVTRTPTATRTGAPPANFVNCNFENGAVGWFGTNFQILLAGGPIGPQYASVGNAGNIYQSFTHAGGNLYATFWVGPNSYGEVRIRNANTGTTYTLWTGNNASWELKQALRANLSSGNYAIEAVAYNNTGIKIDGVMVSRNTYSYCGAGTPTPGPTSFVTPTNTRTATAGASPTRTPTRTSPPSNTPNFTWTPTRTHTPGPTSTSTATATDTATAANDATATSYAATQTAAASITPSATPISSDTPTPAVTATSTPNVPPQPEPAPSADCQRPTEWWNVAHWIDYEVCVVLTWFVWTPANTDEITSWQDAFNEHEPFGTINEIGEGLTYMRDSWQAAGWDDTGAAGAACTADAADLTNDASGILSGDFAFDTEVTPYSPTCELSIASFLGDALASGMCFGVNVLCQNGMLPWIQLVTNAGLVMLFINYLRSTWFVSAVH